MPSEEVTLQAGRAVHGCTHAYYGMACRRRLLLTWKVCDGLLPGFHDFEETQHGGRFYEFDEVQRLRANDAWNKAREKQEELAQHVKKMREEGVEKDIIEEAKRVLNGQARQDQGAPQQGQGSPLTLCEPNGDGRLCLYGVS